MAVFRVHKSKDFTTISNHHLKNKELSLKAKGLLTLMLSLPEDWDYSILGLAALSKDGKDAVMSALNELQATGYIGMESFRNDRGQYESVYNVFENPNRENQCGKSESDNPTQYNTDNNSTDTNNDNNEDNSSSRINTSKNNISSSQEREKKGLDYSFVATEYIQAFGEWLHYKKKMGKMYKTQQGLRRAYNDLVRACDNHPEFALAIVNECIEKEYAGIYLTRELKQKLYGNNGSNSTARNPWCDFADALERAGGIL